MLQQFDNLMKWVVQGAGFVKAYNKVLRNKGSSGVDGVQTEDLPHFMMRHWENIKEELLTGNYQPQAVRGVEIPKSNGGTRQLGIPTVLDRVVQQSIHQTLSPIRDERSGVLRKQNQSSGGALTERTRRDGQPFRFQLWLSSGS